MPEARESEASFLIADAAVTNVISSGVCLQLECIEIDATTKETNRFKKDHPARAGLPYTIDTTCTCAAPFSYILRFKIQRLTHTSVQFYPRTVWESSIKLTYKKLRKMPVGMALVFKDHDLAFLSSDLVFQPTRGDVGDK
ncbi:hypothetical protein K438DRAFT_1785744 [Mycena galopus ATCC 62051]|nr:hypothetical protein K438DRAFT_1785744 [Mycena galopus ATCC 62051]